MTSLKRICYYAAKLQDTRVLAILLLTAALFFFFTDFGSSSDVSAVRSLSSVYNYGSSISSIVSSVADVYNPLQGSRRNLENMIRDIASCNIYNGSWVYDEDTEPLYEPGSCPFIGNQFNCFKNGRPDSEFLKYRWKPHGCQIPRFSGLNMLKMLTGKRLVFVGDSLNRNMFQSLIYSLRGALDDKSRLHQVSKAQGYLSFRFSDFNISIDFVKSPFLVQESKIEDKEVLRLDTIDGSSSYYQDADIIIFNTGHWWTHSKVKKGEDYFVEGDKIHKRLETIDAYTRALKTWARWIDSNIDKERTRIFFRGYSASHFKGGQWNSGGSCDGETKPIADEENLSPYPVMMQKFESVLSEMKTPVAYMNVTMMTDLRKDGHPSVFREVQDSGTRQDCSHWCLPGIPDHWNQILYATLLTDYYNSAAT